MCIHTCVSACMFVCACVCGQHTPPFYTHHHNHHPLLQTHQPPKNHQTHSPGEGAAAEASGGSGSGGPAFALHKDVYEVLLYAVEHSTASTNDREKIAKLWRDFFKVGRLD